jgi:DNA-directed RNA polymerase specialized sigma24 family protein
VDVLELADRVLTRAERDAFLLWEVTGAGYVRIGRLLGISRSSARDRVRRALDRLEVALRDD